MNIYNINWLKAGLFMAAISIVINLLGQVPIINCMIIPFSCISWLALPFLAGFLATKWSKVERDDFSSALKQGLLAGLTFGLIAGFVNLFVGLMFSLLNISATSMYSFLQDEGAADMLGNFTFLQIGIIGQLVCSAFGFIINVAISILGGIMQVALSKE